MNREEEIERASVYHLNQYDYSYEEGEHLDLYIKGFTEGVKWADKHPNIEDIWHDRMEYPKFEFEYIVYYSSHISKHEIDKPFNIISLYGGIEHLWSLVIKNLGITKWTYLETLLSKSGAKIV